MNSSNAHLRIIEGQGPTIPPSEYHLFATAILAVVRFLRHLITKG